MKWFLTTSYDFVEYPHWTFKDFKDAKLTAQFLTRSVGNMYLWKGTQGKPIKWMEVKQ